MCISIGHQEKNYIFFCILDPNGNAFLVSPNEFDTNKNLNENVFKKALRILYMDFEPNKSTLIYYLVETKWSFNLKWNSLNQI